MAGFIKSTLGKIGGIFDSISFVAINAGIKYMTDILKDELRKDPATEKLVKYINIIPARRDGKKIISEILINKKYSYRLDRGYGPREHYGHPYMHFHISRWREYNPSGPAMPDSRGWFHFKQITHFIKPRNFVQKTMRRAVLLPDIIKNQIKIALK